LACGKEAAASRLFITAVAFGDVGIFPSGQLEKGIGADRFTTERLLLAVGARKSDVAEEWTLNPL
jgi:hypothetical protein